MRHWVILRWLCGGQIGIGPASRVRARMEIAMVGLGFCVLDAAATEERSVCRTLRGL
jgi:hypothetical protein